MEKIEKQLKDLFKDNRIVMWYDDTGEFQDDFDALDLPDVEKILIDHNEFGIKYRVMKEEPETKFLLYSPAPPPANSDNWLLDLSLANPAYTADRYGMLLQELGWERNLLDAVRNHFGFFNNKNRTEQLRKTLKDDVPESPFHAVDAMIAAICKCDVNLDSILLRLLVEWGEEDKGKMIAEIEKFNLAERLWAWVAESMGYKAETPNVMDFCLKLFSACMRTPGNAEGNISVHDAEVFMSHWMDSNKYRESFKIISKRIADKLNISGYVENMKLDELTSLDLYEDIEKGVIKNIVSAFTDKKMSPDEILSVVKTRRSFFWYDEFSDIYETVYHAADLFAQLNKSSLNIGSPLQGITSYTTSHYKIDRAYRNHVIARDKANQKGILGRLCDTVDNWYTNNFLMKLNDNWQNSIDPLREWEFNNCTLQSDFFDKYVKPFTDKGQRIFVIISDALRYEIASELYDEILTENRFIAEISSMVSLLPSYTQLGMASLLPHKKLQIMPDTTVLADGMKTAGTEYRKKVLEKCGVKSKIYKADEFLKTSSMRLRKEIKGIELIYIYSEGVDAIGDSVKTEKQTFSAAASEIKKIIDILKLIANANGNHALITADHGFLYQDMKLDTSFYAGVEDDGYGKEVSKVNRRFVVGKGLEEQTGLKKFNAADLNLEGDMEILIPRSINRLRVKGSGECFVHGGASLQEVVLPVIKFTKKRVDVQEKVDVDIINKQEKISVKQISVTFYQDQPVEATVLPVTLKAGFYASDGTLISNSVELAFDSSDKMAGNRQQSANFAFSSKLDEYNNQEIKLVMKEAIPGSDMEVDYKSFPFMVSVAIEWDDF